MASLPDGTYYVYNGYGSSLVMSVENNGLTDGSNVSVATMAGTDAQVWQVSTRSDGSRQITSRLTGKCVDVASTEVGGNVQIWTDAASRYQAWTITDTGSTMTVSGTSYALFKINMAASGYTTRCIELIGNSGFVSGTNTCIADYSGASDMKWAFVPIPKFKSGGVYEMVLKLDTRFCADVSCWSKANGASLILAGRHGGNNQKFYLHERSTDHWTIRNMNSGRYIQVQNGAAEDLTDVNQWGSDSEPSGSRFLWKPVEYADTTIGNTSYKTVKMYSYVDGAGDAFLMDANQHSTLDLGNICICHLDPDTEGQYSQMWVLVPTTATDDSLPVPSGMGWVTSVGDASYSLLLPAATRLYPTWYIPRSWAASGPNHYEWRYSVRYMDLLGRWVQDVDVDTVTWQTANVTVINGRAWVTNGLPATYAASSYKAIGYDIQVRCVGATPVDDGSGGTDTIAVAGNAAAFQVRAIAEQSMTVGNPTMSPDGLSVPFTSDYDGGTNVLILTSLNVGGTEVLDHELAFDALDRSGSVLVPMTALRDWIPTGSVTVGWRQGTDLMPDFGVGHSASKSVSYASGSGQSLSATVEMGDGRTLMVTPNPRRDVEMAWVAVTDEALLPMHMGSDGRWRIEYPFGDGLKVIVTSSNSAGTSWGVWTRAYEDGIVESKRPCHAWNWDGGSFTLELREGDPLETSYEVRSDTEAVNLDGRPWQSVLVGPTATGTLQAEGNFGTALDVEATRSKLEAMRLAAHVRYRSPHGIWCDVCVTGYNLTCSRGIWSASVDMIREAT